MWTPKRILVLALGFALFLSAYAFYGHVLGRIDGLPPLPEECWPLDGVDPPPFHQHESLLEQRLQQAFGAQCEELKWSIQLEARPRGLVMAAKDFKLEGNRVYLAPLSVAIFGKTAPGTYPEVNTIRSKHAWLTFDGAVTSPLDMGKRKILAAELEGNVTVVNNRH